MLIQLPFTNTKNRHNFFPERLTKLVICKKFKRKLRNTKRDWRERTDESTKEAVCSGLTNWLATTFRQFLL